MAVRPIITDQEHRALRGKAKRVPRVDASLQKLIDDMVETMREYDGVTAEDIQACLLFAAHQPLPG